MFFVSLKVFSPQGILIQRYSNPIKEHHPSYTNSPDALRFQQAQHEDPRLPAFFFFIDQHI